MLDKFTISANYPCHSYKRIRMTLIPIISHQKFDRKCPVCKTRWIITATVIKRNKEETTITLAEWQLSLPHQKREDNHGPARI